MKSIVERLNDFHLYLKGNGYGGRNVFEVEIGKKPGYLTTALKKGTGLGSDVLENLATPPRWATSWEAGSHPSTLTSTNGRWTRPTGR